jgi:hypothetical protein
MAAKMLLLSPPAFNLGTTAGGQRRMSVFLWVAGALITLAGLAVIATGAIPHDAMFDSENLTPGAVALVGGLLLIGIGVAVRELRRIERAIANRPPRAAQFEEGQAADLGEANGQPRIPFPLKPTVSPTPAGAVAAALSVEDTTSEHLRTKIPNQSEAEPAFAAGDAATLSRLPLSPENLRERRESGVRGNSGNGATPPRALPDVEARPRLSGSPAAPRGRGLNALWPGGQRREQTAAAHAQAAVARALPAGAPALASEARSDVVAAASHKADVAILKSGVIEGMAYTLYSDGSIEAQLPQGTLRFGSIAALRDHIESQS